MWLLSPARVLVLAIAVLRDVRRKLLRREPLIDVKGGFENGIIRHHKIHHEAVPPTCNVYKDLSTTPSSIIAVAESGDETNLEPPTT